MSDVRGTMRGRSVLERFIIGRLSRGPLGRLLEPQQIARRDQFEAVTLPAGRFVVLGDSITEYGLWTEWFPSMPLVNRGVAGETSSQVLSRLPSAINEPSIVSLLIGTNDLTQAIAPVQIARTIAAIVSEIERSAPRAAIFVNSIMPRAARFAREILATNRLIEEDIAHRSQVRYLDLWPTLADPHGRLTPAYSTDGLHLNGQGYQAWTDILRPAFTSISLNSPRARPLELRD